MDEMFSNSLIQIKLIKKDSTPNNAIHPHLKEVVVFSHHLDKYG